MGAAAPSTYGRAAWLFLRLLGIVYLLAFWSLGDQIQGLIGENGLLPALAWVSTSDAALHALCIGGAALASLLVAGILPWLVLPLLWLAYLSVASRPFLPYQWDTLLLETGFLSIFLTPLTRFERWRNPVTPPRVAVWLMLCLLFRLTVGSGLVKLTSGDPTWHGLTALAVHFETQPLPTPLAWYAHQLPLWFLKGSTLMVLAIEIGVPFLIVAPRRWRALAFVPLVGLQALIALTGNYAFFNLLTVALYLFLLDDAAFGRWGSIQAGRAVTGQFRRGLIVAVAVVTIPISVLKFTAALGIEPPGAALLDPLAKVIAPFRIVNTYGLFATMTTTRLEIVLEGSQDGATWVEYEFKYKVGDVRRRPPWVAPYQPRLDWELWFAAFGRFDDEPWLQNLCIKLLQADEAALRLLERDPFQGRKPRQVRAVLYQYRFAEAEARRRDGAWWSRERLGEYSPILSLSTTTPGATDGR